MSTFGEIEEAVMALSLEEQQVLIELISSRIRNSKPEAASGRRLDGSKHPPLTGFASDLSERSGDKVRKLLEERRNAADR